MDIKLTAHTKLIWSWIIDLNVAVRTIKLLGENTGEKPLDTGFGNNFWG